MCRGNPPEFQAICQLQNRALACFKASGADNFTAFRKGYQSPVKQGIQIRDKQESIEYIQPFLVGVTICPWLSMAGTKYLRQVDAGNRARSSPVIEQGLAKGILSYTLFDHSHNFGVEGGYLCQFLFDF